MYACCADVRDAYLPKIKTEYHTKLMKRLLLFTILLATLLSACGNTAPATEPVDLQATAEVLAVQMIAMTEAAYSPTPPSTEVPPTAVPPTAVPPTVAPTEPAPTAAPPTIAPPIEPPPPTANEVVVDIPTITPTAWIAPNKIAPLKFINRTGEKITFIIRYPIYKEYIFTDTFRTEIQFGTYEYVAWIGDDGPYVGSFFINNADKWELEFQPGKIIFRIP